jgi:hypothetical protein
MVFRDYQEVWLVVLTLLITCDIFYDIALDMVENEDNFLSNHFRNISLANKNSRS